MKKIYDVTYNRQDKKWYVIGFCGFNNRTLRQEWMVISTAFADKNTAISWMKRQYQADRSALLELQSYCASIAGGNDR